VIQLGESFTLVALGGEPMADYSLRLKGELRQEGRPVWIAGYSNLVHAYVPTRRVLLEGGYEGTEAVIYQSLPGPFAVEVEERIVESVHRQVHALRSKK
jgi:neutral ceramidase